MDSSSDPSVSDPKLPQLANLLLGDENDNSSNLNSQTETLFSENPSSEDEEENVETSEEQSAQELMVSRFSGQELGDEHQHVTASGHHHLLHQQQQLSQIGDQINPQELATASGMQRLSISSAGQSLASSSHIFSNAMHQTCPHSHIQDSFRPGYAIEIVPEIEVDEEFINFSILARAQPPLVGNVPPQYSIQPLRIKRQFDDVEYLNHVLVNAAYPGYGLVVPPLPERPQLDQILEVQRQASSIIVIEHLLYHPNYQKDCWQLEQYLKYMLLHPTFGKDQFWQRFLLTLEAPPKIKLKKTSGLLGSLFGAMGGSSTGSSVSGVGGVGLSGESIEPSTANVSNRVKAMHRDCDEFFQKEREWLAMYLVRMKEFNENFDAKTQSRTSKSELFSLFCRMRRAFCIFPICVFNSYAVCHDF